jgi:hypothetical protein
MEEEEAMNTAENQQEEKKKISQHKELGRRGRSGERFFLLNSSFLSLENPK